jgi:hypothetical protein
LVTVVLPQVGDASHTHKGKTQWPIGIPPQEGGYHSYPTKLGQLRHWLAHPIFCPTRHAGLRALQVVAGGAAA